MESMYSMNKHKNAYLVNCVAGRFSRQIRETRQSLRDSESGLERLAIGHHIGDRAHIYERSRNRRTGDREDRQDYINLDESESCR